MPTVSSCLLPPKAPSSQTTSSKTVLSTKIPPMASISPPEVLRTMVRGENTITNNTTGNTRDLGTDTYIETPAGGASAGDIADAVWNEVIADHLTSGTTGKTLKDAKTKATLASIK